MKSLKWFPILASLVVVLILSACSSATPAATVAPEEATAPPAEETEAVTEEPAASGEAVELRYGLWDSAQQPAYQACAAEFTKRNPNITVTIEQAGWGEYWDGLTAAFVAGTAPDVFTNHIAKYPELLSKGVLLDIQPYMDDVDLSIYLVDPELWVKDGARYGLPQDWDTIALFYNKDMFEAAGVTEEEIAGWTWNPEDGGTFMESIAKLTLDAEGRNGLDPDFDKDNVVQFGFTGNAGDGASGAQTDWSAFAASTGFQSTDGPWTTVYHYDDPRVAATVQWWADLHLVHGYAPGTDELSGGIEPFFLAGKTAMFPMGSWFVGGTADATFNVGFAPLPEGPEGRRSPINGLAPSIWSGTEHPDEAAMWVKFIASPDCANIVGDHGVVFPAIQSGVDRAIAAMEAKGRDVSAFTDIAATPGATYLLPMTEHGTEVRDILQPVLQDIFDGVLMAASPDGLPRANEEINALFE